MLVSDSFTQYHAAAQHDKMPTHGGAGMAQGRDRRQGDAAAGAADAPSVIAPGLRIIGDVASGGVVHVDGEVDGAIRCTELTIGVAGRVRGSVTATAVVVFGNMAGTISARRVRLARSATVEGEVIHERLTVEAGARLDGYYRPVERLDMAVPADADWRPAHPAPETSALRRRALRLFRKSPRSAPSLRRLQGLTPKPLH